MIPDVSSFASALSVILVAIIAFEAYGVYKYTEKDYLLAFASGFILLGFSYALLIPLAFGIKLPTAGYENSDILNYPPRMVIQSVGFVLIALGYSQTPRAKRLLYGLIGLLAVLVGAVILPQATVPYSVDALLYCLNVGLISYVLYHMVEKTKPTDTVMVGFLFMALSQYTGIIDTLQSGELTSFLSQATRLVSLLLFLIAFLEMPKLRQLERALPIHE